MHIVDVLVPSFTGPVKVKQAGPFFERGRLNWWGLRRRPVRPSLLLPIRNNILCGLLATRLKSHLRSSWHPVTGNRRRATRRHRKHVIYPVILSGGSGTRLWPMSRSLYPKQLLALFGDTSLLQQTVSRVAYSPGFAAPLIVANEAHRFIIAEPLRENSVAAAGHWPETV